jgi:hypothetical protein
VEEASGRSSRLWRWWTPPRERRHAGASERMSRREKRTSREIFVRMGLLAGSRTFLGCVRAIYWALILQNLVSWAEPDQLSHAAQMFPDYIEFSHFI